MAKNGKIDTSVQYYHGYKFQIYPDSNNVLLINKFFDARRYVYNWALEQEENQYKLYLDGRIEKKEAFINFYNLCIIFTEYRKLNGNEWLQEIPVGTCREAINCAIQAYKNWFAKLSRKPIFKSSKTLKNTFHPRSDTTYIKGNMLQIEGFSKNLIKIDNRILDYDFSKAKFVDPTVSKDSLGNYYFSFSIIDQKPVTYFEDNNIPKSKPLGIDLNFRKDARVVCSDGTRFTAPDISKEEKKIKRLQRKMTKDINRHKELERTNPDEHIEWSKRSQKRKHLFRKYNKKIVDKNNTFAHTTAKRIIEKNPEVVILESLNIRDEWMKEPWIAKYIKFNPLGSLQYTIKQKCDKYNIPYIESPKQYQSSRICSNCGHIKGNFTRHIYYCPKCGIHIDRDLNAALNLEHLAYTSDFVNNDIILEA